MNKYIILLYAAACIYLEASIKVGIHITHRAVHKIGGMGLEIDGPCTSDNYKAFLDKTLPYNLLFFKKCWHNFTNLQFKFFR